jgi:hypothetical protein
MFHSFGIPPHIGHVICVKSSMMPSNSGYQSQITTIFNQVFIALREAEAGRVLPHSYDLTF